MARTTPAHRSVLTLTFPPDANPNYGGILQAWALQQALGGLDVPSCAGGLGLDARAAARRRVRRLLARVLVLAGAGSRSGGSSEARLIEVGIAEPILRFARAQIQLAGVFDANQRVIPGRARGFAAYVVGSDQIWRPDYADTSDFMLGFLGLEGAARRIAYAPSFGRADPEFAPDTLDELAPLIRRFDAVSVREDAAVAAVERLWQVEAVRLVDPTLLLPPSRYRALAAARSTSEDGVDGVPLISYVLDKSAQTEEIVSAAEDVLGHSAQELLPHRPPSYRDYLAHRSRYRYPVIEAWLAAIDRAEFIVTDSFHGCVFAGIFNVPFAVVINHKRGSARFDTLLRVFGLSDRVASNPAEARDLARRPIDWTEVNIRIQGERERALAFLSSALKAED